MPRSGQPRSLFALRPVSKDALWVLSGQVLAVVSAISSLWVWARYLTPDELGLMALVLATASILVGVVSGPILQAVVVNFPREEAQGHARAFRSVTSHYMRRNLGIVFVVVLLLACLIAQFTEAELIPLLAIPPLFLIDSMREYERMLFACAGRHRVVSAINVADVWVRLVVVWGALELFGGSASVAVAGNALGATIVLILVYRGLQRVAVPAEASPNDAFEQRIRDLLRKVSIPLVPAAVVTNLTEMSARYVIAGATGLYAAGLFSVAYGVVKRPYGMVRDVGAMVLMPLLSREHADGSAAGIRHVRRVWMVGMIAVCLLGGALFWLLSDVIVDALLTSSYSEVETLIPPLVVGIAMYNVATVLDDFLICQSRSGAVLLNRTAGLIANLTLLVWLSTTFGLQGAAWALAGGSGIHLLVALFRVGNLRPNPAGG